MKRDYRLAWGIVGAVAAEWGYERHELFLGGRAQPRVFIRQIAYALCCERFGGATVRLAQILRADRKTLTHACRVVSDRCETEPRLAVRVARLRTRVGSGAIRERDAALATMEALAARGVPA